MAGWIVIGINEEHDIIAVAGLPSRRFALVDFSQVDFLRKRLTDLQPDVLDV